MVQPEVVNTELPGKRNVSLEGVTNERALVRNRLPLNIKDECVI